MTNSLSKVFISHASKNFKLADEIRARLESVGVECWIAPRDIPPGASYGEEISKALQECVAVVFVLTEQANASKAVANELEMAFRFQRLIVPVRIQPIEPASSLAFFVNNVQWVDACHTPIKKRVEEIARIVIAAQNNEPIPRAQPEQKTLMGSIEKNLEGLVRYKVITLSIVVFILALLVGLSTFSSSKVMTRLNDEQALINQDPSLFGLVKVNQFKELQVSSKSFDLQATAYLNLKNPVQAQTSWKAYATGPDLESISIDVSPFAQLSAPGAQMINFSIPTSYTKLVFCMTAVHPTLKQRYAAKWSFSIRSNDSEIIISRTTQDVLVPESAEACK
jgi:hypothetical protein